MDNLVNRLSDSTEKKNPQNTLLKKKPDVKAEEEKKNSTNETNRDVYTPKEENKKVSYFGDPRLKKLILQNVNQTKLPIPPKKPFR